MKVCKSFRFFRSASEKALYVSIMESLESADFTVATWQCAPLLAAYLSVNAEVVSGRTILELGAGTGLPSIAAAKLGAGQIFASERADEQDMLDLLAKNIKLNRVEENCRVLPLSWSQYDAVLSSLPRVDIVLGADIFYFDGDYPSLFRLFRSVFLSNPGAVCVIAYQQRNARLSLWPWLQRHRLQAELIPLVTFLHPAHAEGCCSCSCTVSADGETHDEETIRELPSFSDLLLVKITCAF